MALELQNRVVALVKDITGSTIGKTPVWLLRPGKLECGVRWSLAKQIYADLQARELPETAPPRESRRLDAVLTLPTGETLILEVDETQHFNHYRRLTLERYPSDLAIRFDRDSWTTRCNEKRKLEGVGFGKAKLPLFPDKGGRHRQRAFRDALTDLLPSVHDFGPTLRIGHFEVEEWIFTGEARRRMTELLRGRGLIEQHHPRS